MNSGVNFAAQFRRGPFVLLAWSLAAIAVTQTESSAFAQGEQRNATPGYSSKSVGFSTSHRTGFTRMGTATTGIGFSNILHSSRYLTNTMLLSGSGVALGDVDGDGRCDIYLCRLDGDNVLYRNLGDWKFEDVTQAAGVGCANDDSTGACFADI